MTRFTFIGVAAVDRHDTGAVYGVGRTNHEAFEHAKSEGQVEPGHGPETFVYVPITQKAWDHVQRFGGAPARELCTALTPAQRGVWHRSEEDGGL